MTAWVAAAAPVVAGAVAGEVLPLVPGPTEAEFQAMKAKGQGPFRSKRVLALMGATIGVVAVGGNSVGARAAAAALGGLAGVAIALTKAQLKNNVTALVTKETK